MHPEVKHCFLHILLHTERILPIKKRKEIVAKIARKSVYQSTASTTIRSSSPLCPWNLSKLWWEGIRISIIFLQEVTFYFCCVPRENDEIKENNICWLATYSMSLQSWLVTRNPSCESFINYALCIIIKFKNTHTERRERTVWKLKTGNLPKLKRSDS